ncbi:tetratricopeptide repeat protein [Halalkalibacterium halodurans]|uniref:Tetratrico peptide repeat group 5 domain-containing protein n=2 Tax=Halalkalibacterium halodurans TaxID=86665 RepID=A0A0M0KDX8_ALKHA|nr:tetratricopeptide repeat protein [Halalkalibacterium halodurans]TPE69790.1 tetratricopeptide repeat protein [Halalkalibacterium halodurans]
MDVKQTLEKAIALRQNKRYQESNAILVTLCKEHAHDPQILYQCGWSFDVLGLEAQAVPYYEKAIASGLQGKDLAECYLGLGSTFRTLGEYRKAEAVLANGVKQFPNHQALRVFYAMVLYNLGRYEQGIELLLKMLAETSGDETIQSYKQAILFYADKLGETWKA